MKIINVLEHGLKSDDKLLQRDAFQLIVDQYSAKGNVIYFPQGVYVLSTIFLRNDTHVFISKDAYILGAHSFYDYAPEEKIDYPIYQDSSHTYFDCSLFVGRDISNISIEGEGTIDMRSVWDLDNVRNIVHRGPKCIALKNCQNISLQDFKLLNATDLAIYFAGCENVQINNLYLKVYIDGISPDNSSNVSIKNCYVESGDDGIVFKSSYTLNRLGKCQNIKVKNCICKSRCNAIKFGTETNGGFEKIQIQNIAIFNSRITGISVESVDGANIKDISFKNISMKNVGTPFFVHIGKRMRGPKDLKIGSIENISFKNITAEGPYEVYDCLPWNYDTFVKEDCLQFPGVCSKDKVEEPGTWQVTSNVCGLPGHLLKNIYFKNIKMTLDGGVQEYPKEITEEPKEYPEVHTYGRVLPASGIFFRHIDGLKLKNVQINLLHEDKRPLYVYEDVKF